MHPQINVGSQNDIFNKTQVKNLIKQYFFQRKIFFQKKKSQIFKKPIYQKMTEVQQLENVDDLFQSFEKEIERRRNDKYLKSQNKNFCVGSFAKYYGKEYFRQHRLSTDSSVEEIKAWMESKNISFEPLFDEQILKRKNKPGNYVSVYTDDVSRESSKKLFEYAQSKGYNFKFNTIHISPDDTSLQYCIDVILSE